MRFLQNQLPRQSFQNPRKIASIVIFDIAENVGCWLVYAKLINDTRGERGLATSGWTSHPEVNISAATASPSEKLGFLINPLASICEA
jgi:hypothetical protein